MNLRVCEPGMTHKQPFSRLASSRAIHTPTTLCGSLYTYVESRWIDTEETQEDIRETISQVKRFTCFSNKWLFEDVQCLTYGRFDKIKVTCDAL